METMWEGSTKAADLHKHVVQARHSLADAARSFDWPGVLAILARHRDCINAWRLDGQSWYTPLHQAAHAGAPVEIVHTLVALGAWRTLPDAQGERALDIAARLGHPHLQAALTPVLIHQVPDQVLARIQAHFHAVIRGRIDQPLPGHLLRLPELAPMLELEQAAMHFPVPGMYGGFSYRLQSTGVEAELVAESWSRVSGGSGQRHAITADGSRLVAEGFV